jgi:hypothetical protein
MTMREGKHCSKCKCYLSFDEFHIDRSKVSGRHSQCKLCLSTARKEKRLTDSKWRDAECEKSRQYKIDNPEEYKTAIRNSTLRKKYGIGIAEYDVILENQGGKCKICRSNETKVSWSTNLHVDHCHTTGEIRGLLCQPCNVSLGKMNDDPELLRRAALYLEGGL